MASSSSSDIIRYHAYLSFHGPDLPSGFLSQLHNRFASKGITTFNDQNIERGQTIGPESVKAIKESKIAIVVLSKNYASSSWCLDELVEILKCKEASGQIVIPIFHRVSPSLIRTVGGAFGRVFKKTCEGKTEEVKLRWRNALAHVGSMAGEDCTLWSDEASLVENIATRISDILKVK